jgi:NADPH:quinone reductase-like Zn-dependent oxidoreductase
MTQRINRKIVLVKRPSGEVTPDCLKLVEEPAPEPKEGEALVRNLYLSLDPTQQGWMKYDTYMPAIPIGDVVRSGGVGEVIESRSPLYTKGQLVSGLVGCQVLRNVFSDDGRVLLIERGSHMDGEYRAASVRPGTVRIPVVWQRIRTPNGVTVDIDSGHRSARRIRHRQPVDNRWGNASARPCCCP